MHRKTYALLVFQAEFEVNKGFGILDEVALKYLKEVTTDVILAFFLLYKRNLQTVKITIKM